MNAVTAIKTGLKKTITFKGRAAKSEYLWLLVFSIIISSALFWLFNLLAYLEPEIWPFLLLLPPSLMVLPLGSSFIRRMHDVGFSAGLPVVFALLATISIWLTAKYGFITETFFRLDLVGADGEVFISDTKTDLNTVTINLGTSIVAFTAALMLLFLAVISIRPSQPNPNKYGPNPNEVSS